MRAIRCTTESHDGTIARMESSAVAVAVPPVRTIETSDGERRLLELWLHGRSRHTTRAYGRDASQLRGFANKPLAEITLDDLQRFADSLGGAAASQHRTLSAIKSLFAFAHRLGALPFDVAAPLRLPKLRDRLSERILPEGEVLELIFRGAGKPRDRALLRLLYAAGLRVSELCGLCWRDCAERGDAGQITVFGKGGKTRTVLLSPATWAELSALRKDAVPDAPVFRSRKKGGPLSAQQVGVIVRAAAAKAGLEKAVSPHWLRHAHASHNLDRGTPIHLVQATLGHASVATTGRYLHARPTDSSARHLAV
jgi:site-specific recombinase XerD